MFLGDINTLFMILASHDFGLSGGFLINWGNYYCGKKKFTLLLIDWDILVSILRLYRGAKYRRWIFSERDPNFINFLLSASFFPKVRQLNSTENHFCGILLHCYQYPLWLKLVSTSKSVVHFLQSPKKTSKNEMFSVRLSAILTTWSAAKKKKLNQRMQYLCR